VTLLGSVLLLIVYEAVMTRPEHLIVAGLRPRRSARCWMRSRQ
jgi:hypothetical protein